MKRIKMKYIILILLIVFSLYFCNYSKYRRYKFFLDPVGGACETIDASKEVGVFIEEYVPEKRKYKILNQTIEINDAWTEYCWFPSKFYYIPDTIYKDYKTLVFNYHDEIKNYNEEEGFFIDNPYIHKLDNSKIVAYSLREYVSIGGIDQSVNIDTIILSVYKGRFEFNKENYEKLGEIKLFKKK